VPGPEYERLSDGAHLAVVLAERDARLAGQDVVSVEHLLVALAESDEQVAQRLASFGVTVDALRDRVAEWGVARPVGAVERTVFSPTLRRAVQLGGRVAAQERSPMIEGRHLLSALLEVEDEFVLRVLISLGVDPGALRRRPADEPDAPTRPRRTLLALLTGR